MNREKYVDNEVFGIMMEHLREVTVELFGAYELPIQPLAGDDAAQLTTSERSAAAIIGFAGEKVRGALILCASNTSIERWMAVLGAGPGEENDTLGEFSNMLLGRLKGRLLAEGVTLLLSTPTTTSGSDLRLSPPLVQSGTQFFAGDDWSVMARLDATFDSGFSRGASSSSMEAAAEAGDAMLF